MQVRALPVQWCQKATAAGGGPGRGRTEHALKHTARQCHPLWTDQWTNAAVVKTRQFHLFTTWLLQQVTSIFITILSQHSLICKLNYSIRVNMQIWWKIYRIHETNNPRQCTTSVRDCVLTCGQVRGAHVRRAAVRGGDCQLLQIKRSKKYNHYPSHKYRSFMSSHHKPLFHVNFPSIYKITPLAAAVINYTDFLLQLLKHANRLERKTSERINNIYRTRIKNITEHRLCIEQHSLRYRVISVDQIPPLNRSSSLETLFNQKQTQHEPWATKLARGEWEGANRRRGKKRIGKGGASTNKQTTTTTTARGWRQRLAQVRFSRQGNAREERKEGERVAGRLANSGTVPTRSPVHGLRRGRRREHEMF